MPKYFDTTETFKYKFYATNSSMKQLISQLREEKKIDGICQQKSLNIDLLKDFFKLKMRGFNNTEVAQKMGVNRVTIQRYADMLRKMTESEFEVVYNSVNQNDKQEVKNETIN